MTSKAKNKKSEDVEDDVCVCVFGWRGEPQIPQDSLGQDCPLDTDKHVCLCNLQVGGSQGERFFSELY